MAMQTVAHNKTKSRTAASHASKQQESAPNLCEGVSRASCGNIAHSLDLFPEHTLQAEGKEDLEIDTNI